MAQKRFSISRVVGESYELRSETNKGWCRRFDTLREVAQALIDLRVVLPQVDILIRTDVPHDIEWRSGGRARRYIRLDQEELQGLFKCLP